VGSTRKQLTTSAGTLHVQVDGEGPPAVLWHSLFVDSTSWSRLRPLLQSDRTLISIDGPGHGRSGTPPADFSFDAVPHAALEVLDALSVDGPVDWVGNAWGGHVGLMLAASTPQRIRSLVTIATPAHALTRRERLKIVPMVWAYRLVGAIPPLVSGVAKTILGQEFLKTQPADAELVMRPLRAAPRTGMYRAMRAAMLDRPDISDVLPTVDVPTLMVVASDDPILTVDQARAAAGRMPHAALVVLDADGHIAPILVTAEELAEEVRGFWKDPGARVAL
jgi:pimeloyl-ACP methyl ester carboxylesterase